MELQTIENLADNIQHEAALIMWMVKDGFEYYEKESDKQFANRIKKHIMNIDESKEQLANLLK